jgi:hypothetical protein
MQGREAEHSSHLVPRLRMRGAIPPLPQYFFTAWRLVKHRDIFNFFIINQPLSRVPRTDWIDGWVGPRASLDAGFE